MLKKLIKNSRKKKDIETIKKLLKMKNAISKTKNTLDRINSRLHEVQDQISDLE